MAKLQDKVAIITGAAAGMGKAIAELYAQEGAKVVVSDYNFEGAQAVAEGIKANGGIAIAIKANVADQNDVDGLIDGTINVFGKLDILVNNAGIMDDFGPVADVAVEAWERVMAVNATGPMRTSRKAIPFFVEQKNEPRIPLQNFRFSGG